MTRETADLIRGLTADLSAVRPLHRPSTRAILWCAGSLLYLALFAFAWPHPAGVHADRGFMVEQVAALSTGLLAAGAAFATVVPGRSRMRVLAPLLPLGVWVGSLGQRCAQEWTASSGWPSLVTHWGCLPVTVLAGAVPAVGMVVMLRRGAPLVPRLTAVVAAIAVAGLANVGIRFVHPSDASVVVLTWHVVAVCALLAPTLAFAHHFFSWQRTIAASDVRV